MKKERNEEFMRNSQNTSLLRKEVTMSGLRFKEKQTLRYYMCDRNHTLTMPMLVNLLLDTSGKQSHELGLGDDVMNEMGYSWIILQYEFHIERMPQFKETIEIETFAEEYNKLFCYRNFIVRDEDGNELVKVETTFALIDREKRKMARLPQDVLDPYEATFNKRLKRTPKPHGVNHETAQSKTYHVRYFDIDTNQHVNNSQYLNWVLDSLGSEFLTSHHLTYGNIKFEKEVHEGQTVESLVSIEGDQNVVSAHQIQVGETTNCTASFKWAKIEK